MTYFAKSDFMIFFCCKMGPPNSTPVVAPQICDNGPERYVLLSYKSVHDLAKTVFDTQQRFTVKTFMNYWIIVREVWHRNYLSVIS